MKLVYATRDAGEDRAGGAHCCRRGIRLASLEWVRPCCMDPRSVDPSVLTFFLLSCIAIVTALNPIRRSILHKAPFVARSSPSLGSSLPMGMPKPKKSTFPFGKVFGNRRQGPTRQQRGQTLLKIVRAGRLLGTDRQDREDGERREKPPKVPWGDPTRQGKAARSGARGRPWRGRTSRNSPRRRTPRSPTSLDKKARSPAERGNRSPADGFVSSPSRSG